MFALLSSFPTEAATKALSDAGQQGVLFQWLVGTIVVLAGVIVFLVQRFDKGRRRRDAHYLAKEQELKAELQTRTTHWVRQLREKDGQINEQNRLINQYLTDLRESALDSGQQEKQSMEIIAGISDVLKALQSSNGTLVLVVKDEALAVKDFILKNFKPYHVVASEKDGVGTASSGSA